MSGSVSLPITAGAGGYLTVIVNDGHTVYIGFDIGQTFQTDIKNIPAAVKPVLRELREYFEGTRQEFTVSINQKGTKFQQEVWQAIQRIPYGKTRTYAEIAEDIGRPTSYRAVANACGQNNIAIIVPCHRVVGGTNLGGYKWGVENKKTLLALELRMSVQQEHGGQRSRPLLSNK